MQPKGGSRPTLNEQEVQITITGQEKTGQAHRVQGN